MPQNERSDSEGFFDRLEWAIDNCGRSQQDLAAAMGVDASRLSEWKRGRRRPRVDNLELIVTALGVDAHWLVTGQGNAWVTPDTVSASEVVAAVRKTLEQYDVRLSAEGPTRSQKTRAEAADRAAAAAQKLAKPKRKKASSGGKGAAGGRKR